MKGAAYRLIRKMGVEYSARNAERDGTDRETPDYEEDGTLYGKLEQRRMPNFERDSSGEEVEHDLEIRAVDVEPDIHELGDSEAWPTRLVHPNGTTYEVVNRHEEDGGVTVLAVVRR